jgi:hypothetical protein
MNVSQSFELSDMPTIQCAVVNTGHHVAVVIALTEADNTMANYRHHS